MEGLTDSDKPHASERDAWIGWLKKRIDLTPHEEGYIRIALGDLQEHNDLLQSKVKELEAEIQRLRDDCPY